MSEDFPGALDVRYVEGDQVIVVYPMLYNDRVCVGSRFDTWGYERGFCFPKGGAALEAARIWDGEGDPPGPWIKEAGTQRYGPGSRSGG